jgi:hypothetical protein
MILRGAIQMDRIIFGDNQFFGINHMSEEKAQAQSEHFKDLSTIINVIDVAYDAGIHAFMFNTHDRVAEICDHFRANPDRYSDLRIYPSLPYAHKYANSVNEKGIVGTLKDVIFPGSSAGEIIGAIARGGKSIIKQDMIETMKLLIDIELRMFRDLNIKAVFLQNIVTDLMLGLGIKEIFIEYSGYIKNKYGVEPAFNSMNMPKLVDFLLDCGIENPIVCSSVNKIGYLMNPDIHSYEETIRTKAFRPMAMSILASGAVSPQNAVDYVVNQKNICSIVFGASSRNHIVQTKEMIEQAWGLNENSA